jgi:hypothetical protein
MCYVHYTIRHVLYGDLPLQDHNGESHGTGPINLGSGGKETPWTAMLALEVCMLK